MRSADRASTSPCGALQRLDERVLRFEDACNVYAITSGDRALLIDFGRGAVLDALGAAGIDSVDWVLHTHHHRDQCQGDEQLAGATRIAVPAREAHLFAGAEASWQRRRTYDVYDLASEWNSLARDVPVDRAVGDYDALVWEDLELLALPSPGHTRGSITYLVDIDGVIWAFCGDLIHSPGKLWTIHDLQWDYVEPDALNVALHSVRTLRDRRPDRLAPSHGSVMTGTGSALEALEGNLLALHRLLGRGYLGVPDTPAPAAVDVRFETVSEHLLTATTAVANFHVLHVDGRALFFDYGFPSWEHAVGAGFRFVEHSLTELRERLGIEHVEVAVPTHYHDDHVCGLSFLRERFGCQIWAFSGFARILERPGDYRLPCLWPTGVPVDRTLADGETFEWRGFGFEVRHQPGHTDYAAAFFGEVDGRRVAVIGDELEYDRSHRLRGAGPIYRNRMPADAFARGIASIRAAQPDVLLTGHNGVIRPERGELDAALAWSHDLEERLVALAAVPVGVAVDPDPVTVHPYLSHGVPGREIAIEVTVRNHLECAATAEIRPAPPPGWKLQPRTRTTDLGVGAQATVSFRLVPSSDAPAGVRIVIPMDVRVGELDLGQVAEGLVRLEASA